jgi:hypothetical protein
MKPSRRELPVTRSRLPATATLPAVPTPALIRNERAAEVQTVLRAKHLTSQTGWLLITIGTIRVIVPGIIGTPFLLAGALVMLPGGPELLARWSGGNSPRLVRAVLRQIGRFLDDLERRYPSVREDAAPVVIEHRRNLDVQ